MTKLLLTIVLSAGLLNATAQINPGLDFKGSHSKPSAVFEENKGQMKDQNWKPRPDVLFYGNQEGMNYYIKDNGVSFQLSRVDSWCEESEEQLMPGKTLGKRPDQVSTYRVDAEWINHNQDFTAEKGKALDGYNNYYNVPDGVEPALFVKQYESVTFQNVWNGIDIHYYGTNGMLETDYLVAPGADYRQIQIQIKGAELSTTADGHLVMKTPFGEIHEGELKVFQGEKRLVGHWVIGKDDIVSFEIPDYNPTLALRIDPLARVWGTYYGGSVGEAGNSITTDRQGNVFLAGWTGSQTNISFGAFQSVIGGGADAFLVKFNTNGVRQWATYYGGSGGDLGYSVATDTSGNVFLAGRTNSTSGIAQGGHQNTFGGLDAFLVKFNSSGVRQWGTYYSGSAPGAGDNNFATTTDLSGNVYLAGTASYYFNSGIAQGGHQNTFGGGAGGISSFDAYLVKFNSNGVRQWGTFYGGGGNDYGFSTTTDTSGNVYLAGFTGSIDSIAQGGFQNNLASLSGDAFLVKFNSGGVRQWGTYYGGTSSDQGNSVCADKSGNVFLAGRTNSTSGIAQGGHQNTFGGGAGGISSFDAYLVKFNSNGVRQWGTFYGGSGNDYGLSTTTDTSGNVFLAGFTGSIDSIAQGGVQNNLASLSGDDAYLVKFNSSGVRQWGTYYGGTDSDQGYSAASDSLGNVYLAGSTSSTIGIAQVGHQDTIGGGTDAFLVKLIEPFITAQPPSATTSCPNSPISLILSASGIGLSYQWQIQAPSTTVFSNVIAGGINNFTGINSSVLTIGNPFGLDGYSFQCIVSNLTYSETSNTATLTLYPTPTITNQPVSVSTCPTQSTSFTLAATGTGLTYQWQNRPNATGTWVNCTNGAVYNGSTNNSLQVLNALGLNNYQYRCIITNSNACTTTSNTATLTLYPTPTITNQPVSVSTCPTQSTSFTLAATGTGLTYQWQNRPNATGTWVNCTNGAVYNGSTNNSLQVLNALGLNNYQYRCIITNSNACTTTSNTATLTLYPTPTITNQPVSVSTCPTQSTSFTLAATGTGLTYQWQNRPNATGTWVNCTNGAVYNGSTNNSLQVLNALGLNNYQYRCIITNSNACTTTSNTATITHYVNPAAVITADGTNTNPVTINPGDATSLLVTGSFNATTPNITWTPSSGLSSSTVADPIAYPAISTTYTASFTNIYGCTQTVTQQVIVNILPNNGSISINSGTSPNSFNILDTIRVQVRLNGVTDIYGAYASLRYYGALAPYMNYVGYTAGTILGTGSSVISTAPVASGIYGYDFGITKIGAVPGYTGTGTLYTFLFKPSSVPTSMIGSQVCFYLDNLTINNATSGAQVGLVNQGPYCFNLTNQANVWPGDLDNNKTVNTSDLLKIGIFYNNTGPVRPNANLQWVAQPSILWGTNTSTPNSDAFKAFADGNGDGIINNADQTSVGFNMGKIHPFLTPLDSLLDGSGFERNQATGNLILTPIPGYINSTQLPQQLDLQVSINNTGGTLNNLYGISFDITADSTIFDLQNTSFNYGGSIFGTQAQDFLSIEYVANGVISVGMTRFNNASINGNGLLCKVRLNTYGSLSQVDTNLVFNATVVAANDSVGTPYAINPFNVQIPYGVTAGIVDVSHLKSEWILYPNPTSGTIFVHYKQSKNENYQITDLQGRVLLTGRLRDTETTVSVDKLSKGVYILKLTESQYSAIFVKQ